MLNSAKLVTLIRCNSVWEADILRDRLESAGIPAFTQGAESARSLSHVGAGLGGVKLQVSEVDLESARQVLDEDVKQHQTAGDWRCPRCDEPNEAAFDFCYSCSLPRGDAPAVSIFEADAEAGGPAAELAWESPKTSAARLETDQQRRNPYRTPAEVREPRPTGNQHPTTAEDLMRGISIWTLLGVWLPIPVFPLIAMAQLFRVAIANAGLLEPFRARWLLLFVINTLLFIGYSSVIFYLIR